MGYRQAVRHRTLTPAFLGSNPSSLIYPTKTFLSEYFDRKVILLNSFISWIGGKKLLRKKILKEFPEEGTYSRYIEVFGGAAWVLFGKDKFADLEVYNDINGNLVNLFRCVKYHPEAVQKELEWIFMSREQFFDAVGQMNFRGMTDIQRAARFYITIHESFGADCRSFGVRSKDIQKKILDLPEISNRLSRVLIENVDFEHLIKTYDRPQTLFYLDPPYYEAEKYYPDRFNPSDHVRLRDALRNILGKFIVSYNDCQEIRDLYSEFCILEVDRADNLVTKSESRRYRELIIKNY